MKELISLDQMFENLKEKNDESKHIIEATEKTVQIIDKIVTAREKLGLTQRDLAKKCGIQQPALARIETCKVIPKINTLIKIAEIVGISIEAFSVAEKQQLQIYFSVSQMTLKTLPYSNNMTGGYSWKQNSTVSLLS